MNERLESSSTDYDDLKRSIAEAVRAVFQEKATELGMSYEDFLDYYFGDQQA